MRTIKDKETNKNKRGFTLLELLTVVAIIGILMMASQTRLVSSLDESLLARASSMAYTTMKLAKHLSVIENKDYIFSASYRGGKPGEAGWTTSIVKIYCSQTPFSPDGYTEFTGWSSYVTENFTGATYVKPKPRLDFLLPMSSATNGATIEGQDEEQGNGTEANPWRTIFKYYGPCQGLDSSNLGKYYVCTQARRKNISLSTAYSGAFHTVAVGGGNFAGSPYLVTEGIGL